MKVCKDRVVMIEYKMVDEKANLIDTTDNGEPLAFIHGHDTLFPALEAALEGHQAGERLTLTLEPDACYGEKDESKIQVISRTQFNFEGEVRVGMQFYTEKNGHDLPVTITKVDNDEVTVDGNHPLAGSTMNIDLVIVEVREAIEAELESGKVQSDEEIFAQ